MFNSTSLTVQTAAKFICIALLFQAGDRQRKYAKNLFSLTETLKTTGHVFQHISNKLRYMEIEHIPPLAYIPSDLHSFHKNLHNSWTIYHANKASPITYPPTNVNPTCNNFIYQTLHWSPLQWTSINNNFPSLDLDFHMIHLKMPPQNHIKLQSVNHLTNTVTISKRTSAETFLFMSKILSYFYEKYANISFKLFYQMDHTLPMAPINCSIGLNDLPSIQEVIQNNGETRLHYTHPCILEKIVRIQQTRWTEYTVHFPTSKVQNIAQQPLKYLNATTRLQTLDFQWTYTNQTAYKLVIQVKLKRQKLPTIWWILPCTESLLTYHKNLFAPSSINTIATTYSYDFKNKHYHTTGRCIPHCHKNIMSQKIRKKTSQTSSWPLPKQVTNGLTPARFYCLPQCGIVETHMKLFHQHVPSWWPHSFSDRCRTHSSNFTTFSRQLTTVFLNLLHLNPSLNTTIYSYKLDRAIAFSGPLQTYQYELSHLNKRLTQKTLMFETLWHSTYPKYKQLEKIITKSLLLHDESLFHQSELLHYSKNQHDID